MTVVVTTMDIVHVTMGSSDTAAIGMVHSGFAPQVYIFGAGTGAGNFDTFSWRGELPLYSGDELIALNIANSWSWVGSGYLVPTQFT
jgi:hypothetical protein